VKDSYACDGETPPSTGPDYGYDPSSSSGGHDMSSGTGAYYSPEGEPRYAPVEHTPESHYALYFKTLTRAWVEANPEEYQRWKNEAQQYYGSDEPAPQVSDDPFSLSEEYTDPEPPPPPYSAPATYDSSTYKPCPPLTNSSISGYAGASLGTCDKSVPHGGKCALRCHVDYQLDGNAYTCYDGVLSYNGQHCSPNPQYGNGLGCEGLPHVRNLPSALIGNCGTSVADGSTCSIQCKPGYILSGSPYTCSKGVLTAHGQRCDKNDTKPPQPPSCPLGTSLAEDTSTPGQTIYLRKSTSAMSSVDWEHFRSAWIALVNSDVVGSFLTTHGQVFQQHASNKFVPWHREFVARIEDELHRIDKCVILPYWDFTVDQAIPPGVSTPGFPPNVNGQAVTRNPGVNGALADPAFLITTNAIPSFTTFTQRLEITHNSAHVWVGGNMAFIGTAPADPLFYMLHAFVDRIWDDWQALHLTEPSQTIIQAINPLQYGNVDRVYDDVDVTEQVKTVGGSGYQFV
jgi:hypothetical protein